MLLQAFLAFSLFSLALNLVILREIGEPNFDGGDELDEEPLNLFGDQDEHLAESPAHFDSPTEEAPLGRGINPEQEYKEYHGADMQNARLKSQPSANGNKGVPPRIRLPSKNQPMGIADNPVGNGAFDVKQSFRGLEAQMTEEERQIFRNLVQQMSLKHENGQSANQSKQRQQFSEPPPKAATAPHFYSAAMQQLPRTMSVKVAKNADLEHTEGGLPNVFRVKERTPEPLDTIGMEYTVKSSHSEFNLHGIFQSNARSYLPKSVEVDDGTLFDYPLSRAQIVGLNKVMAEAREPNRKLLLVTEMSRRAKLDANRERGVSLDYLRASGGFISFERDNKMINRIQVFEVKKAFSKVHGIDFDKWMEGVQVTDPEERQVITASLADPDPWGLFLKSEFMLSILPMLDKQAAYSRAEKKGLLTDRANVIKEHEGTFLQDLFKKALLERHSLLKTAIWDCSKGVVGTDSTDLIELLVTMSNAEKAAVGLNEEGAFGHAKKEEDSVFCKSLAKERELRGKSGNFVKSLIGKKSRSTSNFGKIIVALCERDRKVSGQLTELEQAQLGADVELLHNLFTQFEVNEPLIDMFATYSLTRLRFILDNYAKRHYVLSVYEQFDQLRQHQKVKRVEEEKHFVQVLQSVVDDVYKGRAYFFAKLLAQKMPKLTDDSKLNDFDAYNDISRILVTRAPIDLPDINAEFKHQTGTFLRNALQSVLEQTGTKEANADSRMTLQMYIRIVDWALDGQSQERLSEFLDSGGRSWIPENMNNN